MFALYASIKIAIEHGIVYVDGCYGHCNVGFVAMVNGLDGLIDNRDECLFFYLYFYFYFCLEFEHIFVVLVFYSVGTRIYYLQIDWI